MLDVHGFSSVWTPERHFHDFGGLFPNAAVTNAAVAAITENVGIRSGSVVWDLNGITMEEFKSPFNNSH